MIYERTYVWGQDIIGSPTLPNISEDEFDVSKGDEIIIHFDFTQPFNGDIQMFGVGFQTPGDEPDLTAGDIKNFTSSFMREDGIGSDNPTTDPCGGPVPFHQDGTLQYTTNWCYRNYATNVAVDQCKGHIWTVRLKCGKGKKTYTLQFQIHGG